MSLRLESSKRDQPEWKNMDMKIACDDFDIGIA